MSELGKATRIPPENFEALKHAEYVVLLYLKLLATSSLIEIGYALALGKEIVILQRRVSGCPWFCLG